MSNLKKPMMLMILDGFGLNENTYGNAIAHAQKPNLDYIFENYPHTSLSASGLSVGLPQGQMGNSEVGHLNIGAGRVVYQELTRISKEIKEGGFFKNKELLGAVEHAKKTGGALNLMGLLSDGGVHSHIEHLFALIDLAKQEGLKEVYVYCFLDGRDVPPRCAEEYINQLQDYMSKAGIGKIAMIAGRYYAMDRDNRWERVSKAYDAMTCGEGLKSSDPLSALKAAYERDENDEFVLPTITSEHCISDGDSIIMFNFRPDRAREITRAIVDTNFEGFDRKKILKDISYVCMTQYDKTIENVSVAYKPESIKNTLGSYISSLNLNQLRIAETEKYAHVTFFFNGGVETPEKNEDRILVPSPKVATYDLKPEMSAYIVTEKVLEAIASDKYDLIILNFANTDMVGHTGVFDAAVKAVEAVDECVGKIRSAILEKDGSILLTADHGNADFMLDEDGNVVTSHSTNPVPLVFISNDRREFKKSGILADIAPTILDIMKLEKPAEMTGESLLK